MAIGKKTGGRKAGTANIATREIKALASPHGPGAVAVLADIMNDESAPPAARISAANALLDRGFGKPQQAVEVTGDGIATPPVEVSLSGEALIEELKRRGLPTAVFEE
ncbi:MAG: hypothetical protein FWD62_11745 [Betaproteobacteria bacterium]|nr:hypothetical protein [Betaproteobacteria bacterium]